jgi:hypothetical protein
MAGAAEGAALGFPAGEFRDAIHTAMRMGSPNATLDKATFRWDPQRTYARHSPASQPYIWAAVPVTDLTHDDVVLDEVAVEYTPARRMEGTAVGEFVPMRAEATLLDVDYAAVTGANWVLLHGIPWAITAATVGGLFDVDVWTLFLERS